MSRSREPLAVAITHSALHAAWLDGYRAALVRLEVEVNSCDDLEELLRWLARSLNDEAPPS